MLTITYILIRDCPPRNLSISGESLWETSVYQRVIPCLDYSLSSTVSRNVKLDIPKDSAYYCFPFTVSMIGLLYPHLYLVQLFYHYLPVILTHQCLSLI